MSNLYYLYPFNFKRLLRPAFLLITPGVITILCHAQTFFTPVYLGDAVNTYIESIVSRQFPFSDTFGIDENLTTDGENVDRGPSPRAEDDFATTPEESPVSMNVLANDRSGGGDDDDDNNDARIDTKTVDLNPEEDGIQKMHSTPAGIYTVNPEGTVTLQPLVNFAGTTSIRYTVRSRGRETSNVATITVDVTNINDAPQITGLGSGTISAIAGQPVTITLDDLVVTDPDNLPGDLMLNILPGENYQVSGTSVIPDGGFSGNLPVHVQVGDGDADSEIYTLNLAVARQENQPPVITGQNSVSTAEDTPVAIGASHLQVADPDDNWPADFTIQLGGGENYSVAGMTITPAPNYFGLLSVPVTVNDGEATSAPFNVEVSVTAVNDPPVIFGQTPLSTPEDQPVAISVSHLTIDDPDSESFTLSILGGDNYSVSGNQITPASGFNGPLIVRIFVSDGVNNSGIFNFEVTVNATNDPPVITGQRDITIEQGASVTLSLADVTVSDTDNTFPTGFTMRVLPGENYTLSGNTVTPTADFSGQLEVGVIVNDGTDDSELYPLLITVTPVVVAPGIPVITGQAALSTNEEQPVTLLLSHLTVVDLDNAYPTGFSMVVSPGTNYTVTGTTVTPELNFAGTLTIPVTVSDGVNTSPVFNFQLQVNQINDPPSFDPIPNQQVTENSPAGSLIITGISKGPGENDQQITFVATSSNTAIIENPVVQYNGTGRTAALSYAVRPNMSGTVTLTIVAIDNGSNVPPNKNSYTGSFQVQVVDVNTAPTLNPIGNITILEDAEQQNVALSGITAGAGETQSLTVTVSVSKPDYFDLLQVVYTSPETTGTLQFKTKPDLSGTVKVSVTVTDNGPSGAQHTNKITRSFSLIIKPVNDPPVFTSQPRTLAVVQEEYSYSIMVSDPDGDKVTISAPQKPAWASLAINGQARLHGKPPSGAIGNFNVTLQATDGNSTVEQSFVIYVNVRPSLESLSLAGEEDSPVVFSLNFFSSGYSDQNDDPIKSLLLLSVPASGRLMLGEIQTKAGDSISAASLSQLAYYPDENFFGDDSFSWKASDGYHYSLESARVNIAIVPVNDPPKVILGNDTLYYEVNGEPELLAPMIDIVDPDDDTLTQASIGFHTANYRPDMDALQYDITGNIRANFDFQTGVLRLTGIAPLSDYRTVLRSIRYVYQNTVDPILERKGVYFTLNDGKADGEPINKVIVLQYTFIEFNIPSGFTPNGDQANDTWIIERPGGELEGLEEAVISVYNQHGVLVYRTLGFDRPWDGTRDGELLPAGTYFFTIDLHLRNKKTYKGIVTILR